MQRYDCPNLDARQALHVLHIGSGRTFNNDNKVLYIYFTVYLLLADTVCTR